MRVILRLVLFIGLASGIAACKSTESKKEASAAQPAAAGSPDSSDLTWTEAKARAKMLKDIAYTVTVKLNETDETFKGQSKIQFTVTEAPSTPLRLELYEGEVKAMTANGSPLAADAKKKFWIEIPVAALKVGPNTVTVDYILPYSKQGQGLHRFVDPQTKEVFLYTQFETFDANRFMPCFDQPDPKSTLQLTVEAPAKWEVVSTTAETSVTKAATRRIWKFDKTPALSTYLFSLHAGPYKVWRDRFEDIPLRIFARPSMAQYVRAQEWFTITKQGLRFYNGFFALPYPFKKYDQLFVPEFNAGAMENVGAVTFSERYLVRSQVTRNQRRDAASVLLHEMAHMWFGDIVTMKWWNDLWLNESFATIMAAVSMAEATEFKEAWQDFFGDKAWAYWQDSLITTHPIEAPVATVKEAFANFDGITYGKGAAVIKQLRAYITPAAFKAGVQDYFKTYAYKNAELKDFIGSLQKHTQRDLSAWADRWLRQDGTDKLTAKWTCDGTSLKQIELITTTASGRKFRPQTVQVGLYKQTGGQIKVAETIAVELKEEKQSLTGTWTCPDFVYPNHLDDGYIAVSLDPKSLTFVKGNLSRIPDVFARTMLWYDLWEMVRNTEMPLKDYVKVLDQHFGPEKDTLLLTEIVRRITGKGSVLHYWPTEGGAVAEKEKFIGNMERNFLSRFRSAKAGSDAQKFWFDQYTGIAKSEAALTQLARWAEETKVGPGFPLDVDRQWGLVTQLARYQHKDVPRLLEMMKKKDASDRGERQALAVEAIQPNEEVKRKWVGQLAQAKPELPYASARVVLRSMFPVEQGPLAKRFEADFYSYLKANGASEDENYVETFAQGAAPLDCEQQTSSKFKSFLGETGRFSPSVVKVLKISLEEDERCQRVRAMAEL